MNAVVAIVALALAYAVLTWPLVRRLERRMPRALAIVLIDIGLAIAAAALGFGLAPVIASQAQAIVAALPDAGSALLSAMPQTLQHWLAGAVTQASLNAASYAREALGAAVTLARSVATMVGAAVVIPILAAYFQLDAQRYSKALLAVVPRKWHAQVHGSISEISLSVGRIVRGQIIVSALVGVLVYIVLAAMGIKFAVIIALVTAVSDVVPYLGGIAAFLPSLLFALTSGGVTRALLVGLLLLVVFEFEAQYLAPQIVGSNTRLAPSLIIVVLLAGTALFGVLGLFLAVPVTAVIGAGIRGFNAPATGASGNLGIG
jgi:predicted PurR-regulated permease PerM